MELIDPDFLVLMDEALRTMFGGDFPLPSAPLGMVLQAKAFDNIFGNLLKSFRAANNETVARGLRDTMIHAELYIANNEILGDFTVAMNKRVPSDSVMDVSELNDVVKIIFEEYVDRFYQLMDETFGAQDQMEESDKKLRETA